MDIKDRSSFQYGYNVAAVNSPAEVGGCSEGDAAPSKQGGGLGAARVGRGRQGETAHTH